MEEREAIFFYSAPDTTRDRNDNINDDGDGDTNFQGNNYISYLVTLTLTWYPSLVIQFNF
jgi:hypothetical protein